MKAVPSLMLLKILTVGLSHFLLLASGSGFPSPTFPLLCVWSLCFLYNAFLPCLWCLSHELLGGAKPAGSFVRTVGLIRCEFAPGIIRSGHFVGSHKCAIRRVDPERTPAVHRRYQPGQPHQELLGRGRPRGHHFVQGSCSCGRFWGGASSGLRDGRKNRALSWARRGWRGVEAL